MGRLVVDRKPKGAGKMPNGASAPIDLVFLARQTGDDEALSQEVLQLYIKQAEIYVGNLRDAANTKIWYNVCHSLKGSSREVGALELASIIERYEEISTEQFEMRTEMLSEIELSLGLVKQFIQQLLGE